MNYMPLHDLAAFVTGNSVTMSPSSNRRYLLASTGELVQLVNARTLRVNNKPLGYINDLAIAKDGTIYFTSSSTKWTLGKENNIIFEADRSGRSECAS